MQRVFRFGQTLVDIKTQPGPNLHRPIDTKVISENDIGQSDIATVFNHAKPIGIAAGYSQQGQLLALCLSDESSCRVVEFDYPKHHRRPQSQEVPDRKHARHLLQTHVLCRPAGECFAFDMGKIAMALYSDLGLLISKAVDIQSGLSGGERSVLKSVQAIAGDTLKINEEVLEQVFADPVYSESNRNRASDLAQRAWLAQFLPAYENGAEALDGVPRIDTSAMNLTQLEVLSKLGSDAMKLDSMKSTETKHRFTSSIDHSNNGVRLSATEYASKFRSGKGLKMELRNKHGATFTVSGQMDAVEGKSGTVITERQGFANKDVLSVVSLGRDGPTKAESARDATVLRALQGNGKNVVRNPWINNIWFADETTGLVWPPEWNHIQKPAPPPRQRTNKQPQGPILSLNHSQRDAVNSMYSSDDAHRIVIVQGPPGTGKTSVIASYIQIATAMATGETKGIYVIAQSNVAVKNIAEKLVKVGFEGWRLLVSKDFRYEWNDHLYHKVEKYTIQSNGFKFDLNKNKLKGISVILCTLSALSNHWVQILASSNYLPLTTLIVDEASQIGIGDYFSVFDKFQRTLRKACFIGDDKQLPPYGQESNTDLKSIFEVEHLKKNIIFLDTQYRMPPQIGRIVSDEVYNGKLKSNPKHPVTDSTTACYFVDVPSYEKPVHGGSTKNEEECAAIIKLARRLQDEGKEYKIITPYEGQRNLIEQQMRQEDLEWGDKCFNVDSFQGNEEDYILISVVRTRSVGFLGNLRRTNVMLTRCKKGMFIFSNRKFLEGVGYDTLVGHYAAKTPSTGWLNKDNLEGGDFLEN